MVSISIVTYNTSYNDLKLLFESFERVRITIQICIVDNSPLNSLKSYFDYKSNVIYIHNPANPGFGTAHNIAIKKAIDSGSNYPFLPQLL